MIRMLSHLATGIFGLVFIVSTAAGQSGDPIAPLLKDMGTLHMPVTTKSERAQLFIDQGMRMLYGFNHAESERSFKEAARLDSDCAMAYWGQALALGPNINDPMPPERELKAYAAIQKARKLKKKASAKERDFIDALTKRYSKGKAEKRQELDAAFMTSMKALHAKYPDDPDIATVYAAAIMNTMPWNYWKKDGQPTSEATTEVLRVLEETIASYPDHPGAHHYYIHIVEASTDPDRGVPSAERLGGLIPAAGHLVHMPSHIFIRVGRYDEAAASNVNAIAADENYIEQCQAQGLYPIGYYPHNIHFLWSATTLDGRSREAIEAAKKVASTAHMDMVHSYPAVQEFLAVPLYAYVRFGKWDEILNMKQPASHIYYANAIWHYARALAFNARGQMEEANAELKNLQRAAKNEAMKDYVFSLNPVPTTLELAIHIVAGEIAARQGKTDEAVRHLKAAVDIQDNQTYSEPAPWHFPVRHNLGAILYEAGRADEAEMVYKEDLKHNRNNGWSLFGLLQSLRAQGKMQEAEEVTQRLRKAWSRSDVILTSSRF